ncbi:MAG TPA: hypothetical protein IAC31_00095 [Candidatus Faecousia intestinigallinarum]|nr:hypothetical protein [Candidatus Faecousia intestinigallinarum]
MQESYVYYIPRNYNASGYALNGMVSMRKLYDAIGGALLGFLLCSILPLGSSLTNIAVYILVCGFLALIGLVGIRDEPWSSYLLYLIRWLRVRHKPYFYNHNGQAFRITAADYSLNATRLEDHLSALLEKLGQITAPKEQIFVEGETFQFASDPYSDALHMAENDQQPVPVEEHKTAADFAIQDVLANIVLPDLEEGSK